MQEEHDDDEKEDDEGVRKEVEVRVGIKGSRRDRLVCFNTLTEPLGGSIRVEETGTLHIPRIIIDRRSSTSRGRRKGE